MLPLSYLSCGSRYSVSPILSNAPSCHPAGVRHMAFPILWAEAHAQWSILTGGQSTGTAQRPYTRGEDAVSTMLIEEVNDKGDPAQANKIVFKVPTKINPVYERSPFHIGTQLWNELPQSTQESTFIFEFKKILSRNNKVYKNLLL